MPDGTGTFDPRDPDKADIVSDDPPAVTPELTAAIAAFDGDPEEQPADLNQIMGTLTNRTDVAELLWHMVADLDFPVRTALHLAVGWYDEAWPPVMLALQPDERVQELGDRIITAALSGDGALVKVACEGEHPERVTLALLGALGFMRVQLRRVCNMAGIDEAESWRAHQINKAQHPGGSNAQ